MGSSPTRTIEVPERCNWQGCHKDAVSARTVSLPTGDESQPWNWAIRVCEEHTTSRYIFEDTPRNVGLALVPERDCPSSPPSPPPPPVQKESFHCAFECCSADVTQHVGRLNLGLGIIHVFSCKRHKEFVTTMYERLVDGPDDE